MEVVPDSRHFHKEIVMTIVMTVVALLKAMKTEAFFVYLNSCSKPSTFSKVSRS